MKRNFLGFNPDGTPNVELVYEGAEGGGLLLTGLVTGPHQVTLSDGTSYTLDRGMIEHAPGHGGALAHHAAKINESLGGLPLPDGTRVESTHACTDLCGSEAETA